MKCLRFLIRFARSLSGERIYKAWCLTAMLGAGQSSLYLWVYAYVKRVSVLSLLVLGKESHYWHYLGFNLFALVVLRLGKQPITAGLSQLLDWARLPNQRMIRLMVFFLLCFVVFSYHTKLRTGFWHEGIAGWHFADVHRRPEYPELLPGVVLESAMSPSLKSGLLGILTRREGLREDSAETVATEAMLLHYADQILPANWELVDMVFPEYVFSTAGPGLKRKRELFGIIKRSLVQRSVGRKFLLPEYVAYPNHAVYRHIDYSSYPPLTHF